MNTIIIFVSFAISMALINFGTSTKIYVENLRNEDLKLEANNFGVKQQIKDKESLIKRDPMSLSMAYGLVTNQVNILESYNGTRMNVQLEGVKDTDDVSAHYVDTEYRGIKGLKIRIVVDKFSKETDMGTVLDDIYLLEKSTDFVATQISKDNNNLIVKGEIYGI